MGLDWIGAPLSYIPRLGVDTTTRPCHDSVNSGCVRPIQTDRTAQYSIVSCQDGVNKNRVGTTYLPFSVHGQTKEEKWGRTATNNTTWCKCRNRCASVTASTSEPRARYPQSASIWHDSTDAIQFGTILRSKGQRRRRRRTRQQDIVLVKHHKHSHQHKTKDNRHQSPNQKQPFDWFVDPTATIQGTTGNKKKVLSV